MAQPTTPQQAIILSGFDYEGRGVDFPSIGRNRQARLLAANPQLTVILMDVGAGTTTVSAMTTGATGKPARTVTSTQTHTPVTAANYSAGLRKHTRFDKLQAGRMSITDLYEAIRAVGAVNATQGTLVEVSIFSHGAMQGPILVNSFDSQPGARARDPNDKDGRPKDFTPPNMAAAQQVQLAAAFAADAFWWNWGCAFTESYRQVTHCFITSPTYSKAPAGSLKDTDKITFNFQQAMAQQIYDDDAIFFPQTKRSGSRDADKFKDLVFERTVKEIKEFFLRGVRYGYYGAVLDGGGPAVRGAFLGTYSEYEYKDKTIKLPLMAVPRNYKIYGADFRRHLTMWVKVLGFTTDPENHGYGVHTP